MDNNNIRANRQMSLNIKKTFTGCPATRVYTVSNCAIDIDEFLQLQKSGVYVIDVRTPAEYHQGHIPGVINVPLFDNDERIAVGTAYKQVSREKAILEGLKFIGPRLKEMAETGLHLVNQNPETLEKKLLIHCWRGGMRSSSFAWLLNMFGIQTYTLKRGYKNFRKYIVKTFELPFFVTVLGGKTGSGKTILLHELGKQGEQAIDLEGLAFHRGSAFGAVGQAIQKDKVTQEQFENELATLLRGFNQDTRVWVEDESRQVGSIVIPADFWQTIRSSPVAYIDIPCDIRANYLVQQYGNIEDIVALKQSFFDIKKRLGDARYNDALQAMENNDLLTACKIALDYYDRAYEHGLAKRDPDTVKKITIEKFNIEETARLLTGISKNLV